MSIRIIPKFGSNLPPEEPNSKGINFAKLSEKLRFQQSLKPYLGDRLLTIYQCNGCCDLFKSNLYFGSSHPWNEIHHVIRNCNDYIGDNVYDEIGAILAKI